MPKSEFDSSHSASKLSNNVFLESFLWLLSLLLLFAQVSVVVCVIIALLFWGQAYQTSDRNPHSHPTKKYCDVFV